MNGLFSKEATIWLRSAQGEKSVRHLDSIEQTRTKYSCPGSNWRSVSPKACWPPGLWGGHWPKRITTGKCMEVLPWRCWLSFWLIFLVGLAGSEAVRRTLMLCECHVFLQGFKKPNRTNARQGRNKPVPGWKVPCRSFTAALAVLRNTS